LIATGDVQLNQPLNLITWLGAGQYEPIDLTVRAAGNLTIGANISDGVTGSGSTLAALASGASSSLRFVAGADLTSANPMAVVSTPGGSNLEVGGGVAVRTGTGDIDLIAGGNVQFDSGASVYTVGNQLGVSKGLVRFSYLDGGGSIVVDAGQDVLGSTVTQTVQSASDWQAYTQSKGVASFGVNLGAFAWNLATLGGGDLTVAAGGSIRELSAGTATSDIPASVSLTGQSALLGGGGLNVTAGGDLNSSEFYIAQGVGVLRAGGALSTDATSAAGSPLIGNLLWLGDAKLSVTAGGDALLDGMLNPTALDQAALGNAATIVPFFTYSGNSAVTVQSLTGSVSFDQSQQAQWLDAAALNGEGSQALPASLSLQSLSRDVNLNTDGSVTALFPSNSSQLELFAARDIVDTSMTLWMSDEADASINTLASTSAGSNGIAALESAPFQSARHIDDLTPAIVVAGRDIDALSVSVPKAGTVEAGRDITNLYYFGQNLNASDLTLIDAGRNFTDSLTQQVGQVRVGGPGRLDILAGGNINLGLSTGVTTTGNLLNGNLSTTTGADITMIAGLGASPDYSQFLQQIIEPSSTYQQQLVSFVESLTGQSGQSTSQADTEFASLTSNQQRQFIDQVFFESLQSSGEAASSGSSAGFSQGYAAIDALFPGSRTASPQHQAGDPYVGNLTLTFTEIYTLDGGSISLLVPGGLLNVGLANQPSGIVSRPASDLGIVAQGLGNVNIYTKSDVDVNNSRIFTTGGGNVLIWSDEGSIDAGRGAQSTVVAPPPTIVINQDGTITLDFSDAAVGSGIRTIQTNPRVPAGNVYLYAPQGTVNAGDAGIAAAGNIDIAAQAVLNVNNIQFGGSATGVPAQISSLGASLSSASSSASGATTTAAASVASSEQNAAAAAPLAQAAISWLDVFVTGLGEENCRPDDLECLKRQKNE
jgi:hypothetical protein